MAAQKTECFVLRRTPLRETSWILTVLSRSFGKLRGVVKGARKEKNTWASSCELMTHANMVFFEKPKTGLHLITELSIVDSHEKLRNHFPALTYASYFSELLDQLLEDHGTHPRIFELLKASVKLLEDRKRNFLLLARIFEIKLLERLGLLPRFSDCIGCGMAFGGKVYFNSKQGGVFCKLCHRKFGGSFEISQGSLQAIRFILKSTPQKASQIKLGNQIRKELEQITKQFIEYRIEHPIKALRFISQVYPLLSHH